MQCWPKSWNPSPASELWTTSPRSWTLNKYGSVRFAGACADTAYISTIGSRAWMCQENLMGVAPRLQQGFKHWTTRSSQENLQIWGCSISWPAGSLSSFVVDSRVPRLGRHMSTGVPWTQEQPKGLYRFAISLIRFVIHINSLKSVLDIAKYVDDSSRAQIATDQAIQC